MTIKFYCPNCDSIIAFGSKHAGKRARCINCGQIFIIPSKDDEKPQAIAPEPEEKGDPVPGFCRAVFLDSSKIFFNRDNATPLVFVVAVVCFKFFLSNSCCGFPISIIVWGWLFGFYLNIIYETAFGIDNLPEISLGSSVTFLWYVIKPFLVFFFTMFLVQLPLIIALFLLKNKGLSFHNMWQAHTSLNLLLQTLCIFGLSLFPMAILTTAVGQDFTLLRPDYILAPIFKAPVPYIAITALLVAAAVLAMHTTQFFKAPYEKVDFALTAAYLGLNLAVQIIAIFAMRSIGLFYRHYSCYMKW